MHFLCMIVSQDKKSFFLNFAGMNRSGFHLSEVGKNWAVTREGGEEYIFLSQGR